MIIGLTGGIGSGKTRAGLIFERLGAYIIDTDSIARSVIEKADVQKKLQESFPSVFENGKLNRGILKEIIFDSEHKREILNDIMHPIIRERVSAELNRAKGIVVVIVPLLFESGFDSMMDKTINIETSQSIRIERIVKRDNISKELALKIMKSQMSNEERRERADYTIYNNGTLQDLECEIQRYFRAWSKV